VPEVGVEIVEVVSSEDEDWSVEVEVVPKEHREVGFVLKDGDGDFEEFLGNVTADVEEEPEGGCWGDSGEVSVEWVFEVEVIAVGGLAMNLNHLEGGAGLLSVCEDTPRRFGDGTLYSNGFPEEVLEEMEEPTVVDAGVDGKRGRVS
jgi:hypothetical protein